MAKQIRATDQLNIELSCISAALNIAKRMAGDLPPSEQRDGILKILEAADQAHDNARDQMLAISQHANAI
jgi:hypothetical protein